MRPRFRMSFFNVPNNQWAALYRHVIEKGTKIGWSWTAIYLNDVARIKAKDGRLEFELKGEVDKEWHYIYTEADDSPWGRDIRLLANMATQAEYKHYEAADNQLMKSSRFEKIEIE